MGNRSCLCRNDDSINTFSNAVRPSSFNVMQIENSLHTSIPKAKAKSSGEREVSSSPAKKSKVIWYKRGTKRLFKRHCTKIISGRGEILSGVDYTVSNSSNAVTDGSTQESNLVIQGESEILKQDTQKNYGKSSGEKSNDHTEQDLACFEDLASFDLSIDDDQYSNESALIAQSTVNLKDPLNLVIKEGLNVDEESSSGAILVRSTTPNANLKNYQCSCNKCPHFTAIVQAVARFKCPQEKKLIHILHGYSIFNEAIDFFKYLDSLLLYARNYLERFDNDENVAFQALTGVTITNGVLSSNKRAYTAQMTIEGLQEQATNREVLEGQVSSELLHSDITPCVDSSINLVSPFKPQNTVIRPEIKLEESHSDTHGNTNDGSIGMCRSKLEDYLCSCGECPHRAEISTAVTKWNLVLRIQQIDSVCRILQAYCVYNEAAHLDLEFMLESALDCILLYAGDEQKAFHALTLLLDQEWILSTSTSEELVPRTCTPLNQ